MSKRYELQRTGLFNGSEHSKFKAYMPHIMELSPSGNLLAQFDYKQKTFLFNTTTKKQIPHKIPQSVLTLTFSPDDNNLFFYGVGKRDILKYNIKEKT